MDRLPAPAWELRPVRPDIESVTTVHRMLPGAARPASRTGWTRDQIGGLVAGGVTVLGSCLPWATVDGPFGTVFYTLTGFHGAHVFGGAVGLTIILARAMQGQFSGRNHIAVEAVSIYWHFVDVVWIAVFSTIYLLR